jgi:tyrosine-protein phosphatase non-receptor type 9
MNDCKRSNYDLGLSQKILTLVKGSYPARLNKLLVVSAPFWFKCVVKVLSILLREKLRERVFFVTNDELAEQVPVEILPDYLGGNVKIDHKRWLVECNKLVTNNSSSCKVYYSSSSISSISSMSTTSSSNSSKKYSQNNDFIKNKENFCRNIEPLPFRDW